MPNLWPSAILDGGKSFDCWRLNPHLCGDCLVGAKASRLFWALKILSLMWHSVHLSLKRAASIELRQVWRLVPLTQHWSNISTGAVSQSFASPLKAHESTVCVILKFELSSVHGIVIHRILAVCWWPHCEKVWPSLGQFNFCSWSYDLGVGRQVC